MNYLNIFKELNEIAPLELQEEWDNSGWQINLNNPDIERVLVAMDITDDVIDEAIFEKCQLIVTHHPLFFGSFNEIDSNKLIGNYAVRLIGAGISVYASHTPFDKVKGGNNDYLGKLLDLEDVGYLKGDDSKFLRTGYLKKKCNISEFADFCSNKLNLSKEFFNFVGDKDAKVKKIAWCTGAGADFIELVKYNECDLYLTGDLKYHTALEAKAISLNVLDLGHYATEHTFVDNMSNKLKNLKGLKVVESKVNNNPFSII